MQNEKVTIFLDHNARMDSMPSNFINGHVPTVWFMVYYWP